MAKKKKRGLDPSILFVVMPGMTNTLTQLTPTVAKEIIELYEPVAQDATRTYMSWSRAWLEYTGIPAMIGGGLGAFGINVGLQAGQVRSGTSLFAASRYGFGLALILESTIGAALLATAFTILDTQDLHEGGLTNEPLGKTLYEHLSPERIIVENESVPNMWKMIWLSGQ